MNERCLSPILNHPQLDTRVSILTSVDHPNESWREETTAQLGALRQANQLLQAFFNAGNHYQVLLSPELSIVAYNNMAAEFTASFLGKTLQEGICIAELVGEPFAGEFQLIAAKALAGETIEYEHFFRTGSGEKLWFIFTLAPVYQAGDIVGLSMTGTNINKQKNQEQTIRTQSETLHVIAQLQSHQVRQPVTSILGIINLIKEDDYTASKEYIDCLEQATHQLDQVIQTIVAQSRG